MAANYIKMITDYKKQWQDANNAGDTAGAEKAAKDAQKIYEQMYQAGYTDVADKLKKSDYSGAVKVQDAYGTDGKVSTRDFSKSVLSKYGYIYNPDDFAYDEGNQNVTFKGVNLGKADYVSSDGKSYYDPKTLETKLKDVAGILGLSAPDKTAYSTTRDKLISEQLAALDIAKNTNPFETEIGKSIMANYGIKGDKAGADAVATVASGSGGNIDSFAAANKKRQELVFKNAGEQAVLADHNARIANIQNILSGLGVTTQNTFNNSETSLNNQVARDTQTSGVTGVVSGNMAMANNPFFNADGTLKDATIDYQEIINNAPDEVTKQNAIQARQYKVTMPEYSKYAAGAGSVAPVKTAAKELQDANIELTREQMASNEKIATIGATAKKATSGASGGSKTKTTKPTLTAAQAKAAYDSGVTTQAVVDAYNYYYGTDVQTAESGAGNNEERVKNLIYSVPNDGSDPTYYPLQELQRNRVNYERATNSDFVNKLIVEEAKKILRAEGGKIGKWEVGEILKREGFSDYKTLEKLFK